MILWPQYWGLQISENQKIFLYSFGDKIWPDLFWFIGKIKHELMRIYLPFIYPTKFK